MKDKKRFISIAAILLVGIFIWQLVLFNLKSSDVANGNADISSEQLEMHEEYPELPENNRFVKESGANITQRLESGTGVVVLGFKECPWCQKAAPLLNQAAEQEGVNIYYLDIRQERENNGLEYQQLVTILSPFLQKDENGSSRISTPDISFVKNGEIVWRYELESMTEDEGTPEAYWTEARKERAIQAFRDQMRNLKEV